MVKFVFKLIPVVICRNNSLTTKVVNYFCFYKFITLKAYENHYLS